MLRVLRIDEEIWHEAMGGFEKYSDQEFSFTDCTSFALMRMQKIDVVFGFDHHFEILGFDVQPIMR